MFYGPGEGLRPGLLRDSLGGAAGIWGTRVTLAGYSVPVKPKQSTLCESEESGHVSYSYVTFFLVIKMKRQVI